MTFNVYAEYCYADCRNHVHYAVCHYSACHYTECRSSTYTVVKMYGLNGLISECGYYIL
jgi:hypothetical protein